VKTKISAARPGGADDYDDYMPRQAREACVRLLAALDQVEEAAAELTATPAPGCCSWPEIREDVRALLWVVRNVHAFVQGACPPLNTEFRT
jgi:hypothetical protein